MEKVFLQPSVLFVLFLTIDLSAQTGKSALDEFIEGAQTIVVVKCLKAGPVDILGRSRVDLDVIQVVKGDPQMKTLSLNLRHGMQPGKNYLVRIPSFPEGKSNKSMPGDSVIPVSEHEDLALLKTLSPTIVVLRTMNVRIDELESVIRQSTYELANLKTIKGSN